MIEEKKAHTIKVNKMQRTGRERVLPHFPKIHDVEIAYFNWIEKCLSIDVYLPELFQLKLRNIVIQ